MASAAGNEQKKITRNFIPVDDIKELVSRGVQRADVSLARRTARGQLAHWGKLVLTMEELADASEWARPNVGGGKWFFDVREENNPTERLMDPFEIEVEGPKMDKGYGTAPMGGPVGQHIPPVGGFINAGGVPVAAVPAGGPGYSATQHYNHGAPQPPQPHMQPHGANISPWAAQYAGQQGAPGYTQPVATHTSDAVAMGQLEEVNKKLAAMEKEREADRKASDRREEDLRKQVEDERQRARDAQVAAERESLLAQMRAMQEEMSAIKNAPAKEKDTGMVDMLAIVIPGLATVLTGMMSASKDRDALAMDRQSKAQEMQMAGVNTLLQASVKSDSKPMLEMVVQLAPILAPIAKEWWEAKSPRAQMDLVATMAENNVSTISMMAQLIDQFAQQGGDTPWYLPMIQETMQGVVQVAESVANRNKEATGGAQPQQQQQAGAAAPAGQAQATNVTEGEQVAFALNQDPDYPAELKTQEWTKIVIFLHNEHDPAEMGKAIAGYIRHLDENNALPAFLADVWDHPAETLSAFFKRFPVATRNRNYADQVYDRTIADLESDEDEEAAPQQRAQGGPTVTPAPGPNGAAQPQTPAPTAGMAIGQRVGHG